MKVKAFRVTAEWRTVSLKRSAGRGRYKPHHTGSEKNWRTGRTHGWHSSTFKARKQAEALNRAYLGAADPIECDAVLALATREQLWDLAMVHGVLLSERKYLTLDRLVERRWGAPAWCSR